MICLRFNMKRAERLFFNVEEKFLRLSLGEYGRQQPSSKFHD